MFAIPFEVLLIEIQEEIHHFAGWEGGGGQGAPKIVNKNFVNKLAFPNICNTRRHALKIRVSGLVSRNPKYQPFWVSRLFYKAPPRQFQPPKCKLAPSKKGLATSNLRILYRTTQKSPLPNLHFGGCQFAFWSLKLSWGCFIEKAGPPKRLVLWVSPIVHVRCPSIMLPNSKHVTSMPRVHRASMLWVHGAAKVLWHLSLLGQSCPTHLKSVG